MAGPRLSVEARATDKKNYSERLSRAIAPLLANLLRKDFPQITPGADGDRQEEAARTSKGTKPLDVNYSTPMLGLGLGVSVKTINFRDVASGRYTKNFTARDNELRAEALDYHERQPWAMLVAIIFLPVDSCDDYKRSEGSSSFGQSIRIFRHRAGRERPTDPGSLFERVFIGLYAPDDDDSWDVRFFDVMQPPPRSGRPKESSVLTLSEVITEIVKTYDARNNPPFAWAGE